MSETSTNEPPPGDPKVVETPAEAPERATLASGVVRRMSLWSAGAGVIPVPGVDLAVIVGLQVKTVRELALIYGVPFDEVRTKAIVASLIGGLLPFNAAVGVGGLASTLYKAIPGVGAVLGMITMPAAAAAANYALGRLFIEHFESGGTLLDFNAEKMRARFRAEMENPQTRRAAA
ncbi:YcjF family protein [Acidisphaera sp. S103]|uniref:YcjF family protein n=1 Tax=Acidisphaera sp. S103 TaxID=1747223 RepID=UPI00131D3199|nr:DUF697 domain-containing protein [Acidisphaera sp. S103]